LVKGLLEDLFNVGSLGGAAARLVDGLRKFENLKDSGLVYS